MSTSILEPSLDEQPTAAAVAEAALPEDAALRNLLVGANERIKATTSKLAGWMLITAIGFVVAAETGSLDLYDVSWIHYAVVFGVALMAGGQLNATAERQTYLLLEPILRRKAADAGVDWDDLVAAVLGSEQFPSLAVRMTERLSEDTLKA